MPKPKKPPHKTCPFCGSTDVGPMAHHHRSKSIGCKCGCEGPEASTVAKAWELWDQRAKEEEFAELEMMAALREAKI